MKNNIMRCDWAGTNPLMTDYHDNEWGVPVHDDQKLFENLVLDGFQAGLSWLTVLKKREAFREAFDRFNIIRVAGYDDTKIEELMTNASIIRNKQKISAAINNARIVIGIQGSYGSLNSYIWQFSEGKTITNSWKTLQELPVTSAVSDAMSKDMNKRGFSFTGSTICYAFMQAIGMANDHLTFCFRYEELRQLSN